MGEVRKYRVHLDEEQRQRLEAIRRNGHAPAKKMPHARVLLMAEEEHERGRWKDRQIARALGIHVDTVKRIRTRFVREGEVPALRRKPREAPHAPQAGRREGGAAGGAVLPRGPRPLDPEPADR